MQNFLKATERGIDVQLFVRKIKMINIKRILLSWKMTATGQAREFIMQNTDKTAVELSGY